MKRLAEVRRKLRKLSSTETALWFSGGKDSRLLLEIVLAEDLPFAVVCFDDQMTLAQKKAVYARAATRPFYSWHPREAYLVGNGEGDVTLISHYEVGSNGPRLPIVRDLIDGGTKCSVRDVRAPLAKEACPFFIHTVVTGVKRTDRHYVFGDNRLMGADIRIGKVRFAAPLYNWSDADVIEALRDVFSIEWSETKEQNTGNIAACRKCLTETGPVRCPQTNETVAPVQWSPAKNLDLWRRAAGVNV